MAETDRTQPAATEDAAKEAEHPSQKPYTKPKLGPGFINLEGDVGHSNHASTKAIYFASVDAFNEFFEKNPGLLVLRATPIAGQTFNPRSSGGDYYTHETGVFCIYTRVLSPEEHAELMEIDQEVARIMSERKAKRDEARQKEELAKVEREKEEGRLLELGKNCDKHHKQILDELVSLRRELRKVKRNG